MQAAGFAVERQGRHFSARLEGREVYRLTHDDRRGWLFCHQDGVKGGDNIDLVRQIEGVADLPLAEAIHRLDSAAGPCPVAPSVPAARPRPVLPPQTAGAQATGREYLAGRGIDAETIAAAERAGFLHHLPDAVVFIGRDSDGQVMSATRRAIRDDDPGPAKRDFAGSDKSFAPILPGDPGEVWIVEGGADALAIQSMARQAGRRPPTVIVSGGANVRSFLSSPSVRSLLQRAGSVTIARDREKSLDVQARVDAAHQAQAQAVAEIIGRPATAWRPPPTWKDAADLAADRGPKMILGFQAFDMSAAAADAATAAAIREQLARVVSSAELAAIRFHGPAEFVQRAEAVRAAMIAAARPRKTTPPGTPAPGETK